MKNIIVLGAGMVGRAMAVDLSDRYTVTAVDRDDQALKKLKKTKVKTIQADLGKAANITRLVKQADFVVISVPGFMGYKTVEAVIKAGKNAVDISFFDENAFDLDKLAKKHQVSVVVDCGVAPGMGNIIVGHWEKRMTIDSFEYLAAGLPVIRQWPFEYKAPFSPVDVVELYTRPARHRENGVLVVKPAMSETELIHFPEVGTLEAFATDGLRSLLQTSQIPNMVEKTMRYPGHIRLMQAFKEGGFFSEEPVKFGAAKITPLDFTCQVLFKSWKLADTDEEFTVMRAALTGKQN
ncbi:MAG: saccharopine dehydrogenase C-terminal domain-containing protein, partial [Microgenomates group bacterium]